MDGSQLHQRTDHHLFTEDGEEEGEQVLIWLLGQPHHPLDFRNTDLNLAYSPFQSGWLLY